MLRRTSPIATAVLLTTTLGACESSQTQSRRLEKTARDKAQVTTISAGASNTAVKVTGTAVLSNANGSAAVVALQNGGRTAQVQIPLLIGVKDAKGTVVYKNDIDGLQPALQQMAFLAKGEKAYWVNDQVLAPTAPKSVVVQVGKARAAAPAQVPKITLGAPKLIADSSGAYATGEVRNESKITQVNLPIFGVALRDRRVVAAGRALIEKLEPSPTKKPVFYKIFFIGNPRGARLKLTAAPTVLQEARTPS